MDLIKSGSYTEIFMPKHVEQHNKHSGGVSCSACSAFMLVVMKRLIFLSDCQFRSLILRTFFTQNLFVCKWCFKT